MEVLLEGGAEASGAGRVLGRDCEGPAEGGDCCEKGAAFSPTYADAEGMELVERCASLGKWEDEDAGV